ncbi:putative leucine-rich repeat domain, L domain-containing protein [Lupinus albus]|uniref:Putative leucine-rich repeat domain, L domain-containing protein n=1 Tax=Lupinus albus TaxID=3870 RepID=A0A6A4P1Y5_LUPAL|nr:putative leucine-rich repeat domain, L domain-containing protein [Lupinus albus]
MYCNPEKLDRMIEMLITRSRGSLQKLHVFEIQTEKTFTFIAENVNSLKILRLMRCNVTDHIVEQISPKLCMISFMDRLEIIGKNCKMLEGLKRNMHPIDTMDKPLQDDEAYAIGSSMPNLKHLEMTYNLIGTLGVFEIFSKCLKLEILDVRGCWGVKLHKVMVKKCLSIPEKDHLHYWREKFFIHVTFES